MKSFSSSAINKSGKKFAPKAPARRGAPAPPAAPARRSSVTQQQTAPAQPHKTTTQTPSGEPEHVAATSTPAPAPAPAQTAEPPVTSSVPTEPAIADSTGETTKSQSVTTSIPIPRPKRKASVPAPAPTAAEPTPTLPQPTPPPHTQPASELPPVQSIERDPDSDPARIESTEPRDDSRVSPALPEPATEIRPSKRRKTAVETTVAAKKVQPPPARVPTPPAAEVPDVASATDGSVEVGSEVTTDKKKKTAKPTKPAKPRTKRATRSGSTETARGNGKERRSRSRKVREPTPDGAENVEIAPSMVKMSDLCKDLRTGKMSKRETELRNMELAEQERKEKALEEGENSIEQRQTPIKQNGDAGSPPAGADGSADKRGQAGPVMRIVNGEIVLDTASLQVDRHADAEARNVGELEDVVENSLTRKINQATYGKRSKTESWDEEMTDLFYRGLRMFGTDFMVISKMFPGRSRRQIKLKFNSEERKYPQRIKDTLLGPREAVDIATYSEMTNTVYDDPKEIQRQLDEEKKQIEDQHAKEKQAQEELLRNPDAGKVANTAMNGDTAPTKVKPRSNKKQNAKSMNTGTEEVVGSIDDFF